MHALEEFGRDLASLLAPEACVACRTPVGDIGPSDWRRVLCASCRAKLELLEEACRRCGSARGPYLGDEGPCRACAGSARGRVRTTTALFRYRGVGRGVLMALKYRRRDRLGVALGRALGRRWRAREPDAAASPTLWVVPVPLHPFRRWRRGYNQAEEIAVGVAESLGRPWVDALRRRRSTPPLFALEREARERTMAGAFAPRGGRSLVGRTVALVDDIRTSGATLREAAAALHAAGAARVHALVVAR
ncbi:MAG: ComF family protein [Planctomycetota bacterium]|nr:MAG: ComF family protein [Planctomycetota bacterium]